MASLELISAWQRQTGTFCKWVCSESYLLRVFSSFAMPWKEKCAEWMNPTHSWDWQLLCHQQLISLDAGGGRTHISPEHDGFVMCLSYLSKSERKIKKKYVIDTLHATCLKSMAARHLQLRQRFMCSDPSEGTYLTSENKERSLIMTL